MVKRGWLCQGVQPLFFVSCGYVIMENISLLRNFGHGF
jgi:hypothetical protein